MFLPSASSNQVKWHFSIILHSEFDSAHHKTPGKRTRSKVLPCLIHLTLMFWSLYSRKEVKMTSNHKPPLGFGYSTPENPVYEFLKMYPKLAPQFKKGFFFQKICPDYTSSIHKDTSLDYDSPDTSVQGKSFPGSLSMMHLFIASLRVSLYLRRGRPREWLPEFSSPKGLALQGGCLACELHCHTTEAEPPWAWMRWFWRWLSEESPCLTPCPAISRV